MVQHAYTDSHVRDDGGGDRDGTERARAVGAYLDSLSTRRPRRGRKPSPEKMRARISRIRSQLPTSSGVNRVRMMQELKNLERTLVRLETGDQDDFNALEDQFIQHAKAFGESEGIEYSTWIACGVARTVLARAGIFPPGGRMPGSRYADRSSRLPARRPVSS